MLQVSLKLSLILIDLKASQSKIFDISYQSYSGFNFYWIKSRSLRVKTFGVEVAFGILFMG